MLHQMLYLKDLEDLIKMETISIVLLAFGFGLFVGINHKLFGIEVK